MNSANSLSTSRTSSLTACQTDQDQLIAPFIAPFEEIRCAICSDDFGNIEKTNSGNLCDAVGRTIFITECRHTYHRVCLNENRRYFTTCPLCQRRISAIDYKKLRLSELHEEIRDMKKHPTYNSDRDDSLTEILYLVNADDAITQQQFQKQIDNAFRLTPNSCYQGYTCSWNY